MTVNDINVQLFENQLDILAVEFDQSKNDLKIDLAVKLVLDKIKKFVRKWRSFTKTYSITKYKISFIEETGKKLIHFLEDRIVALQDIATIKKGIIEPLEDYLYDFKIEIDVFLDIQRKKYRQQMEG